MIRQKAFHFSVRIVRMVQYLEREHKEYVLSKQVKKVEPVSVQTSQKLNVDKAALISSPKTPLR